MKRSLEARLVRWQGDSQRMPLLIRGARQVGKSTLVEHWGQRSFQRLLTINFDFQPELKACFTSLDPAHILKSIYLHTHQRLQPGQDCLFLDEIQACPQAIRALRYFKEQCPELHVIGAGSLLEFALQCPSLPMPVGRVESLFLYPMSFSEFLQACDQNHLCDYLDQVSLMEPPPETLHTQLLTWVQRYAVIGGMPAVVAAYRDNQDWDQVRHLQRALLASYRDDFAKYASQQRNLHRIFDNLPSWLGQPLKYSKIDPDIRSRDLKVAMEQLRDAGLLMPAIASQASLPLHVTEKRLKQKLYFLDIGLSQCLSGLSVAQSLDPNVLVAHRGPLAEQWVAQNLIALRPANERRALNFWARDKAGSQAEVDFLEIHNHIIPFEVKAGASGRLKSLKQLMAEKNLPLGVQVSGQPLALHGNILSLPFYLLPQWQRLVSIALAKQAPSI